MAPLPIFPPTKASSTVKSFLVASLLLISLTSRADSTCDSTRVNLEGSTVAFPADIDSARVSRGSEYAGFNFHDGRLFGNTSGYRGFVVEGSETYRIETGSSNAGSRRIDAGASIPITVALSADVAVYGSFGDIVCWSCPNYELSLQASSGERDSLYRHVSWGAPTHYVTQIALSPLVGEEFTVRYRISGFAYSYTAIVDAQIVITGVPAAATLLTLCRQTATPTKQETWGSVKGRYR